MFAGSIEKKSRSAMAMNAPLTEIFYVALCADNAAFNSR